MINPKRKLWDAIARAEGEVFGDHLAYGSVAEQIEAALREAFYAGRRAVGGINRPYVFPERNPATCAESLDAKAFDEWVRAAPRG